MSSDKIAETLGLRPLEEIKNEKELPVVQEEKHLPIAQEETRRAEDDESIKDLELARTNIQNIIQKGDGVLQDMIELAKQSESPRAYEVASSLMKTLLDANKDFVEVSSKKKFAVEELTGEKKSETNITNNNLILSTADLLKMIKGENE